MSEATSNVRTDSQDAALLIRADAREYEEAGVKRTAEKKGWGRPSKASRKKQPMKMRK